MLPEWKGLYSDNDSANLTAMRALRKWAPRLKDASPDAPRIVRKAAAELLTRLGEAVPESFPRRNLDSLFGSIERGNPSHSERVTDQNRKTWRADLEQIAPEALVWADAVSFEPRPKGAVPEESQESCRSLHHGSITCD